MAGKKVLVVHDDSDYVEQVTRSLAEAHLDMEVVSVGSGERALDMLGAIAPNIVVVGAELPGVDGYTLTELLRSQPVAAGVPVVIVSVHPTDRSAMRAKEVGASAHLSSGGSMDVLVSEVAALTQAPVASSVASASDAPGVGDGGVVEGPSASETLAGYGAGRQPAGSPPAASAGASATSSAAQPTEAPKPWVPAGHMEHYAGVPDIVAEAAPSAGAG